MELAPAISALIPVVNEAAKHVAYFKEANGELPRYKGAREAGHGGASARREEVGSAWLVCLEQVGRKRKRSENEEI